MEKSACGIVSYAGLSRETLLSLGKTAFSQAQPPVPRRFDTFLPLFPIELIQNMDYVGATDSRGARVAPSGFSIDPVEYHRKLYAQMPELYVEDNFSRNFDYEGRYIGRGVFAVDQAWVERFPQYQPFVGEKLMIYLIGGGFQAVAVPESIYPRGGGVLRNIEQALQIPQHAGLFVQYARARVAAGDPYNAETFTADFVNATGLGVVSFTQSELGRVLQDMSIVKSLQGDQASVGLFTENARRADRVNQYVPMRYACDGFAMEAVDKHTARLAQLCNTDSDYVSDLWIPFQELSAYIDRRSMTLDVRRLCEGYQIAPRYDPETFGGRYPDAVRVAVVRDREMPLLTGEAINNPAYGDGMSPQGLIGRQVYLPDSREMIRQRKLTLEEMPISTANTTLTPREYRRCITLAILQEHKGRLVDAMYRRETALAQIDPDTPVYAKARELLNERVEKLRAIVEREAAFGSLSQMSGYDADIDYLRRKQVHREGDPLATQATRAIPFARDPQREQSIESGYAMRAGLLRLMYAEAALPEPPAEHNVGADDSEDDAHSEPLPTLRAQPRPAAQPTTPTLAPPPDEADEIPPDAPAAPAKGKRPGTGAAAGMPVPTGAEEERPAAAQQEQSAPAPAEPLTPTAAEPTEMGTPDTATLATGVPSPAEASAPAEPEPAPPEAPGEPRKRVSLRDLTGTLAPTPAAPQESAAQATEEPKPKLAYILRRGSEDEASKSYRRMSDMLHKRGK